MHISRGISTSGAFIKECKACLQEFSQKLQTIGYCSVTRLLSSLCERGGNARIGCCIACHCSADMISHKACVQACSKQQCKQTCILWHTHWFSNLGDINDIFCLMNAHALEEDTVTDSMPSLANSIMVKGLFSSLRYPKAYISCVQLSLETFCLHHFGRLCTV